MINDYFDKIFCVNLDRRPDKWELCEKEFAKHGLIVERLPAIEGKTIPYEGRLPAGAIGNAMSHSRILRIAKELGLQSVLIFEDDVEFDNRLQEKFSLWINEVPNNWDLLYLGGNHNWVETLPLCSPHLMKLDNTYATHAYAVKNTLYDLTTQRLETFSTEGDVIMAEIQKVSNSYCFVPNLAWQRAGVSDVFNRYVDYSFLKPKN
jgi:GR25 family glycosyltransferase involved in LPS biosynthesis